MHSCSVLVSLVCILATLRSGNASPENFVRRLKREISICKKQEEFICLQNGVEQTCTRDAYVCCDGFIKKGNECVRCTDQDECPEPSSVQPTIASNVITQCGGNTVYTEVPHRTGILFYTKNSPCEWTIDGPVGSTIQIRTKRIELPDRSFSFLCAWSWSCIVFLCKSSSIQYSDNMGRTSAEHCGREGIPEYTSRGNRVKIIFKNPSNMGAQIELSYEIIGGQDNYTPATIPHYRPTTVAPYIPITTPKPTTTTRKTTRRPITTKSFQTTRARFVEQNNKCYGGRVWIEKRSNCRYICDNNKPESICSFKMYDNKRIPNIPASGCACPHYAKYLKDNALCVNKNQCLPNRNSIPTSTMSTPTYTTKQTPRPTPYIYSTITSSDSTTRRLFFPFFFFTTTIQTPTTTQYVVPTTRYAPPITRYAPPITRYVPSTTRYVPPTTRYVPPSPRYIPTTPRIVVTTTLPPPSQVKCGIQKVHPVLKIYGGSTTEKGTWPWAVQVLKNKNTGTILVCGGTLICNQFVLTAAHCFLDKGHYSPIMSIYSLVVGKHANLNQVESQLGRYETFRRFQFFPHERYTFLPKNQFDIALIKLPNKVGMSDTVRPACVPSTSQYSFGFGGARVNDECISVGWGKTEERAYGSSQNLRSRALKQVALRILPPARCSYVFANFMPSNHMCAIGKTMSDDTCGGDSGGPLMCKRNGRWFIDGIVSYGLNCAEGDPGVYTKVDVYRSWIENTIRKAGGDSNCLDLEKAYRSSTVY